MPRGVEEPKRVVFRRAPVNLFGVDQPELKKGDEDQPKRQAVPAKILGERRVSWSNHGRAFRINRNAARTRSDLSGQLNGGDQAVQFPPGEVCEMLIKTCFKVMAQSWTQPLFCWAAVSS